MSNLNNLLEPPYPRNLMLAAKIERFFSEHALRTTGRELRGGRETIVEAVYDIIEKHLISETEERSRKEMATDGK